MGQPYTHGMWTVKPGHEEQFLTAWSELADSSRSLNSQSARTRRR
jgi:hypothetical protein